MGKLSLTLLILIGLVLVSLGYIIYKNLKNPSLLGTNGEGLLTPCPNKPNCIGSDGSGYAGYTPVSFSRDLEFETIQEALEQTFDKSPYEIQIKTISAPYIHAVAITNKLRFRDDLEFLYDRANKKLHFRSASRVGYDDLGLNQTRMDDLLSIFRKQINSDEEDA